MSDRKTRVESPEAAKARRADDDAAAARQRARDRAGEEALPRKTGRARGTPPK